MPYENQRSLAVDREVHGVRLEVRAVWRQWLKALSQSSPSPGSSDSQISWHSGQTGNRSGSRLGTQTLPHSATTGVPNTIASVSLSFGT